MNRFLKAFSLLMALASAIPLAAITEYTVETVPNVRLSNATYYVSDPEGILSQASRDSINTMLLLLEISSGIETSVVMLPSIGDADIFEFAHSLFRKWGIGDEETNNGLLILYVEDIKKIRFTTGYGLEGSLTDAVSKRIQTQVMIPLFQKGDINGGMVAGIKAIYQLLDTEQYETGYRDDRISEDTEWLALGALVLGIFILALLAVLTSRKSNMCTYCGKNKMRKMSSSQYKAANGHLHQKDIYICQNCGRVVIKDTDLNDDGGMGLALGAMMLGMGLRGLGGSGGGPRGGSFGGGSTGGGGATSGW